MSNSSIFLHDPCIVEKRHAIKYNDLLYQITSMCAWLCLKIKDDPTTEFHHQVTYKHDWLIMPFN